MTELEEVADAMLAEYRAHLKRTDEVNTHSGARVFARLKMPDESYAVIDGVADALERYVRQNIQPRFS